MVGIHVRRGDYVGNPFYVDLSETDYYERAIEQFPPETEFLVFSDDTDFAEEFFPEFEVFNGQDELEDLNMMASCSMGNIIANSSFSWWAAYLNPHGGKVVAPKAWHPDGVERTKCPDNWMRI